MQARRDGRTALAFYYAPGLDVVGLAGYSLAASDRPYGCARSFSCRASTFNRSICFILCTGTNIQGVPGPTSLCVHAFVDYLSFSSLPLDPLVPVVGTFALVIFGYCLTARVLSLLPWNRAEPITIDLLRRTFLSRSRLLDRAESVSWAGCGPGLCSIEAQVESGRGGAERLPGDRFKHGSFAD